MWNISRLGTRTWMVAILCLLTFSPVWAEALLPVPALTARVIDQTGTLAPDAQAALEAKLASYEQTKGSQIVVLMVPTTAPEDIAAYAHRVASTWKIGRRDIGDGLLVLVAKNDRQMRIEVARALEGALPDIAAAQIIDEAMKPRFRTGDFAGGLSAALDQIIARINGENLPSTAQNQTPEDGIGGMLLFFIFLGLFFGLRRLRSKNAIPGSQGSWSGRTDSSGSESGFGDSGSGFGSDNSDNNRSGGGGSFGGGGASGGW